MESKRSKQKAPAVPATGKAEFIRYDQGAERYCMSKKTFMKMAAEANAVYKINQVCIVNVALFEQYLETFRVAN